MSESSSESWRRSEILPDLGECVVFAHWSAAARHIRNHLLSHPEALGWNVLLGNTAFPVDLANADRCWEAAGDLNQNGDQPSSMGQALYDAWSNTLLDEAGGLRAAHPPSVRRAIRDRR